MVTNYVENEYESQGAAIRVVMNVVPAAIFMMFQRRFQMTQQQTKLWRNFSLASLGSLILLVALSGSAAVDRLALYLIPLQLVVFSYLPHIFAARGKASSAMLLCVVAYSATIQFIWLNFATHSEYWLPYRFYPFVD
jgi:hypothetical protein